jgi:hypothetical protein
MWGLAKKASSISLRILYSAYNKQMLANISNFSQTSDYLPIFTSVLITDLLVILLLNTTIIKSRVLRDWYDKYNLSAIVCDVLIIFIGFIIARYLFTQFKQYFGTYSLFKFILLAVAVQVVHDLLFYKLFSGVNRGRNRMLDTFKDYGNEVSYKAILADSGMMIFASLLGAYLIGQSLNTNIIVLIVALYIMPYLLYN